MKLLGREISRKFGITLGILAVFALTGAGFGVYFLVSGGGSEQPQVVPPATTATTQVATTTTQVEPPSETPVIEPPHVRLDPPVVDVAAGRYHTCALHEDGTVSCWGSNETGQIGAGLDTRDSNDPDARYIKTGRTTVPTPTKVKTLDENKELADLTDVTAISSGAFHTCALHSDATVSCWGRNNIGQLGHRGDCTGSLRERLGIRGPCDDTTDRVAGTCSVDRQQYPDPGVLTESGSYASEENCADKVLDASENELKAIQISLFNNHTCALHSDATVSCWGYPLVRPSGEILSFDYITSSAIPVKLPNISGIISMSAGGSHACGIHEDTTASCWGNGTGGTVGDGVADTYRTRSTRRRRLVPLPVKVMHQDANGSLSALDQVKSVHAGRLQTCAIHFDETASCWGQRDVAIDNVRGEIVPGQDRFAAVQDFVTDSAGNSISSFQDIAFNDFDECRIAQQGSIFCSGENSNRGLGEWSTATDQGNFYDAEEVQKIAVGGEHTCIIYGTKSLLSCWGSNEDGQLGTEAS